MLPQHPIPNCFRSYLVFSFKIPWALYEVILSPHCPAFWTAAMDCSSSYQLSLPLPVLDESRIYILPWESSSR